MSFRTLLIVTVVVLASSDAAYAWGPATHIELADSILKHLGLLPAGIAAILSRHRFAYLYGNIAADVVFAKRWSRVKQACHHWTTALAVLAEAREERDAAFAYGYLSHLAADTVAHGKYVPRQIVVSGCSVNFGHFYWELRADARQPERAWATLDEVLQRDHKCHHSALESHLTDTLLSYDLNRMLFDGLNALALRRGFRRTVELWGRHSRWVLPAELLAGYHAECLERIASVLSEGNRSPVLRDDPNGTSAFMQLRVRRRDLRRRQHSGISVERRTLEAAIGLSPRTFNPTAATVTPKTVAPPLVGGAGVRRI